MPDNDMPERMYTDNCLACMTDLVNSHSPWCPIYNLGTCRCESPKQNHDDTRCSKRHATQADPLIGCGSIAKPEDATAALIAEAREALLCVRFSPGRVLVERLADALEAMAKKRDAAIARAEAAERTIARVQELRPKGIEVSVFAEGTKPQPLLVAFLKAELDAILAPEPVTETRCEATLTYHSGDSVTFNYGTLVSEFRTTILRCTRAPHPDEPEAHVFEEAT